MGTWGTGLWSDDFTLDLKDTYMTYLKMGKTHEEAFEELYRETQPDKEEECGHLFWIAIAVLQWDRGHLSELVKARALEALTSGMDVARWESASRADQQKRKNTMQVISEKLNAPQPPPKATKPLKGVKSAWKIGDLISMKLVDISRHKNFLNWGVEEYLGKYILLHVVQTHKERASSLIPDVFDEFPVYMMYDWCGDEPPVVEPDCIPWPALDLTPARDSTAPPSKIWFWGGFLPEKKLWETYEIRLVGRSRNFPAQANLFPDFFEPKQMFSYPAIAPYAALCLREAHASKGVQGK